MKKYLFIIILLLSACRPQPTPTPQPTPQPTAVAIMATSHQLIFPLIPNGTRQCDPKAGIAWAAYGSRLPEDMNILCPSVIHTWSLRPLNYRPSDAPQVRFIQHLACDTAPAMAWGDDVRVNNVELAQMLLGSEFDGVLLFLNEPNEPGQCYMSPVRAGKFYRYVRRTYPNAIIVGPQPSDNDYKAGWVWLRAFYDELERFDAPLPDVGAVHSYLAENPQLLLDSFFGVMAEYTSAPDTVWVTEFGQGDTAVVREMIRTYRDDERVGAYFYFTPRYQEWSEFPDWTLFDGEDGYTLNPVGRVWVEEVGGVVPKPTPRATVVPYP